MINEIICNIVTLEQLAWIPLVVILAVLLVSLFAGDYVNRKTDYLRKWPTWLLVTLPFMVMSVFILSFMFTQVDIFIIILVCAIPFALLAGFSFITVRQKLLDKHETSMAEYKAKYKNKKDFK